MKSLHQYRSSCVKSWRSLPVRSNFPANVFQLDNGLTVIHQSVPTTSVVIVDVWVRAGAIVETDEWSGMAHFLEHMIFKGTQQLAPGVFDAKIENQGGVTNAATSQDYAHYFLTTAATHLESTLPYLAELLLGAAIPDHEFDREREVILEEIRQAHDNPDWQAYQTLMETVYQSHPYGRPIFGTPEKLMQRSPTEMRAFHQAHYQPQNMTVVIVGAVEQARALDLVSRHFDNFAPAASCPIGPTVVEPPLVGIRQRHIRAANLEHARLLMAWRGPGIEQLQQGYGLDLISALLTQGRTSRLVHELREQRQWVQGISSSFSLQRESGLFVVAAWLDPQHLNCVEALVRDRLAELATTPIAPEALARCQRLLCNDYTFSTETPNQLANLYGYYGVLQQPDSATRYPDVISSLTPDELQDLAAQYLLPDHYAVTTLQSH